MNLEEFYAGLPIISVREVLVLGVGLPVLVLFA